MHVGHIVSSIVNEATHLLREESTPTASTVHRTYNTYITYTPLSEKAADLYLKTKEYQDYVGQKICHGLFYKGLDGKFHPLKNRRTGKFHTPKEAMNLKRKCKIIYLKKDKVTLMTKGIGGLPKPVPFRKETATNFKLRYRLCCIFCFWHPGTWEYIGKTRKNYKIHKKEKVNLVKSDEVHANINLKV